MFTPVFLPYLRNYFINSCQTWQKCVQSIHTYFAPIIRSKVKQQGHNLGKYSVNISFSALSHELFHRFLSNLANICRKYTYIFYPTYKVKGQTARSQFRYIFCSHQFFGLISQTISLSPVKLMYKQLMLRKCIYI